MHIAEGFLPATHCLIWGAAATPFVVHGARAVMKQVKEHPERKMLLAAAGAFTFVMSAIKLPSVSGSSSHPTGTGLGAVLFGPPVMAFLSTIVLLFQALLLGHGGLTTLGANIFSMGIAGPWVGYAIYKLAQKAKLSMGIRVFLAMALANLTTYAVTAVQLAISHPDASTGFMGALGKFLVVFAGTQIPLSIAEGIIGVFLFRFLTSMAAPQLTDMGVMSAAETNEKVMAHA